MTNPKIPILTDEEREFLVESNKIEGEDENIDQPTLAWQLLKGEDHLSSTAICKIHKVLMLDKPYPPPRGYYRSVPQINVMIAGRAAPGWHMVDGLMSNWCMDAEDLGWKEAHIRFEHIHPFVDGNGRMGRMLMNWQRLREGLPILIIHTGDEQRDYYKWF